jgi:hypothetical protein
MALARLVDETEQIKGERRAVQGALIGKLDLWTAFAFNRGNHTPPTQIRKDPPPQDHAPAIGSSPNTFRLNL